MDQYTEWLRGYLQDDHMGLWVALRYAERAVRDGVVVGSARSVAYVGLSGMLKSGEIVAGCPAPDGRNFTPDPRGLDGILQELQVELDAPFPPTIGEGLWFAFSRRVAE